ncbi:MAG: hypothetical protein CMF69_06770 [Magnetovibrio sp.]|nr:hypothetical protein [Magnetovibrio sp.]|tara:strand:- start:2586 stop:3542 length:957 start_codon:yes stop_codon:yes gene_type:complete
MTTQKILVCGASGFIGRNMIENLSSLPAFSVHAVYFKSDPIPIKGVTWHRADLRDANSLSKLLDNVDIVIQAAATTSGSKDIINKPHMHVTDNAVMNSLLLRAAFEAKIKHFIFFSCTIMLPSSPKPQKEDDWDINKEILRPYFGAGWSKIYIEKMCEFYAHQSTTKFTVIRHSNIYGPHDKFDLDRSHVFGATITKCMTAKNGEVQVWGDGEETRDFLFVSDLIEFVHLAIAKQPTQFSIFNVGSGTSISVKELVESVISESKKNLSIKFLPNKPTIKSSINLDCDKARRDLGWRPKTSLKAGIKKTLAWWVKEYSK